MAYTAWVLVKTLLQELGKPIHLFATGGVMVFALLIFIGTEMLEVISKITGLME